MVVYYFYIMQFRCSLAYRKKARTMLAHAQELVYNLSELMPTQYQKDTLEAMLGLFLSAQGHPLPEHSQTKSPSALSRFLNINPWSTRDMIRTVRDER